MHGAIFMADGHLHTCTCDMIISGHDQAAAEHVHVAVALNSHPICFFARVVHTVGTGIHFYSRYGCNDIFVLVWRMSNRVQQFQSLPTHNKSVG